MLSEQGLDIRPGDFEHGSDESLAVELSFGEHRTHGAGARATHQVHDECLKLIVGVVPGGDEGALVVAGEFLKGFVACAACVGFKIAGLGGNMDRLVDKGDAKPLGE